MIDTQQKEPATNGNHQPKPKIEKVFDRSIKVGVKTRLKEIRKTIIKIFSSKKTDQNKFSDDYPK